MIRIKKARRRASQNARYLPATVADSTVGEESLYERTPPSDESDGKPEDFSDKITIAQLPLQLSRANKATVYLVLIGRRRGIFDSWTEAQPQVDQFSGNLHKSFKTRNMAIAAAESFRDRRGLLQWQISRTAQQGYPEPTVLKDDAEETMRLFEIEVLPKNLLPALRNNEAARQPIPRSVWMNAFAMKDKITTSESGMAVGSRSQLPSRSKGKARAQSFSASDDDGEFNSEEQSTMKDDGATVRALTAEFIRTILMDADLKKKLEQLEERERRSQVGFGNRLACLENEIKECRKHLGLPIPKPIQSRAG